MKKKDYHCCATCMHFKMDKKVNGIQYLCSRLGFETKTHYTFDCWNPRDDIRKKMKEK